MGFQIPGYFPGLWSVLFRTPDPNVEPITLVHASEVKQRDRLAAFAGTPRLATAVLWVESRDEAMMVEYLVDLGRRSATERAAHFLQEMGARLRLVGRGDRKGFHCPLSQYLLVDALGLSAVHVNRVLRELSEEGTVTFQNGRVVFGNCDALIDFAGFDRTYLDQDGPLLKSPSVCGGSGQPPAKPSFTSVPQSQRTKRSGSRPPDALLAPLLRRGSE